MGLGNYLSVLTSDAAILLNTVIPTKVRKLTYKNFYGK